MGGGGEVPVLVYLDNGWDFFISKIVTNIKPIDRSFHLDAEEIRRMGLEISKYIMV